MTEVIREVENKMQHVVKCINFENHIYAAKTTDRINFSMRVPNVSTVSALNFLRLMTTLKSSRHVSRYCIEQSSPRGVLAEQRAISAKSLICKDKKSLLINGH